MNPRAAVTIFLTPLQSAPPALRRSLRSLGCATVLGLVAPVCLAAGKNPSVQGEVTVFAGAPSGQGYRDGTAAEARFSYPAGIALLPTGELMVADSRNNVIRKVAEDGSVATLAGTFGRIGSANGKATAAEFNGPTAVAADQLGNAFVADTGNNTIRRISGLGQVTTWAGTPRKTGSADGSGAVALFNGPAAIAIDRSGNLYVADGGNNTIRKISVEGAVTTFAGTAGKAGGVDGPGTAALFNYPGDLAFDSVGNLFVADTGNNVIRKIAPDGVVTTVAGAAGQSGSIDGPGSVARFNGVGGIVCDANGDLYVTDAYNHTIRRVSPDGSVTTLAGSVGQWGSVDGPGAKARFKGPARLVLGAHGKLFVTDNNSQIREVTLTGVVSTLTGAPAQSGAVDGEGIAARFNFTNGIAVDHAGNFFVADMDNGTIRKITPAGVVSTFSGKPGSTVQFSGVGALAIDGADNLYATEFYGQTVLKITPAGEVSTFAGSKAQAGSADGKSSAAQFSGPNAIAIDPAGNVYIADYYNNTIRRITPEGIVSTLAGTAGKAGGQDGTGTAALFDGPGGIAADANGNVYVTELGNHTMRKITPAGIVTTLAGRAGQAGSADGVGTAATLNQPWGIALDAHGNLYVCDTGNNSVRKITPAGIVSTVVGKAGPYWNLSGKLPAKLAYPIQIMVHPRTGDLYLTLPDAVMKVTLRDTQLTQSRD